MLFTSGFFPPGFTSDRQPSVRTASEQCLLPEMRACDAVFQSWAGKCLSQVPGEQGGCRTHTLTAQHSCFFRKQGSLVAKSGASRFFKLRNLTWNLASYQAHYIRGKKSFFGLQILHLQKC